MKKYLIRYKTLESHPARPVPSGPVLALQCQNSLSASFIGM
jgi:hypothetical protein